MGKPGPCRYEVAGRGDHEWITTSTLTFHRYQRSSIFKMNDFLLSNMPSLLLDLGSARCMVEKTVDVRPKSLASFLHVQLQLQLQRLRDDGRSDRGQLTRHTEVPHTELLTLIIQVPRIGGGGRNLL